MIETLIPAPVRKRSRGTLKIWHIAETYPPDYGGGTTVYLQEICRILAARGHEVRVLSTEGTDREPYSIRTDHDGPVRVDRLNLPYFRREDPGGWRLGLLAWRKHARKVDALADQLLVEWSPDIIQFHTPHPVCEEFLIALQRRGFPVSGMTHCAWTICPRLNLLQSPACQPCHGPTTLKCLSCLYSNHDGSWPWAMVKVPWRIARLGPFPAYRLWRRSIARGGTSGLVTNSQFMAEKHTPYIGGPVQHIPLGVDLTGRPDRVDYVPQNPLRFGFLAGFQAHKGIWDLLNAAANLKERGLHFELHIWGPGQEGRELEMERWGLQGCAFLHGVFAPQRRWQVLAQVDVLVMATTVCEAFGRVVQEAAAMGIPTVAPHSGGISEQIRDGVDGLLYHFRDRGDLERKLASVIEQPALLAELSGNLQPVVDTRDAIVDLEDFYEQFVPTGTSQS